MKGICVLIYIILLTVVSICKIYTSKSDKRIVGDKSNFVSASYIMNSEKNDINGNVFWNHVFVFYHSFDAVDITCIKTCSLY